MWDANSDFSSPLSSVYMKRGILTTTLLIPAFLVNTVIKLDTREGSLAEKALARANLATMCPADITESQRPRVAKSSESLPMFRLLMVNELGAGKS